MGKQGISHLKPVDLLKDFHQGQLRVYTIGEIELMTAVGITGFWGDACSGQQIILFGTDNRNTFSRMDDRTANRGLALRIVATLHIWCIENGVEVYLFYIRSSRNIRPDFTTRESEHEVARWANQHGFSQVEIPSWWKQFLSRAPKLGWLESPMANLPRHLDTGAIGRLGPVCEWRPLSGIGLQIFDSLGMDYYAIDGLLLSQPYCSDVEREWELIFGSARRKGEIDDFRNQSKSAKYEIAVMITPSEVEEEIWYQSGFRTQSWQCDSAKFGDVLTGAWDVYVKAPPVTHALIFRPRA